MQPIYALLGKMKKIIAFFIVCCVALGVYAQGEEPIIITAPEMTVEKTAYSFTDQGITISVSYGSAYPAEHAYNNLDRTYFGCLANGTITFSAEENIKGIAINGWVRKNFTASCDNGSINYLSDSYDDTEGEPVLTVSDIDATSVSILCNNQLRCFSVEVYFSENPGMPVEEAEDTIRITMNTAVAMDYSDNEEYSSEGSYSYWLMMAPAEAYPQIWLDMYTAEKGNLCGEYSLYNYNVGDYTYIQLSPNELDYEYAYDQEFTITESGEGYRIEGYIIADNDIRYEFVYEGEVPFQGVESGLENDQATHTNCRKVLHNGQLLILRHDKTYTITGIEIR